VDNALIGRRLQEGRRSIRNIHMHDLGRVSHQGASCWGRSAAERGKQSISLRDFLRKECPGLWKKNHASHPWGLLREGEAVKVFSGVTQTHTTSSRRNWLQGPSQKNML